MITYGGPALFVAAVVVIITPLLYVLALKRFRLGVKIAGIVALWTLAIFVAYWDVYQISKEARRLCKEEAGLHVYKTVEAEGFLGASSIDYWSDYGFLYLEMELVGGKKIRYTLVDGEVVKEDVDNLISRYEYVINLEVLKMPLNKQMKIIRDRLTGNVLGEIVSFAIYPGWIDRRLLGFVGFAWAPRVCDGEFVPAQEKLKYLQSDLVKAVIKPVVSTKGE